MICRKIISQKQHLSFKLVILKLATKIENRNKKAFYGNANCRVIADTMFAIISGCFTLCKNIY